MRDTVDNLPRLKIKRILQDIIEQDLGLLLNIEQTQTGFTEDVICWITGMNETYARVSGSKNAMQAECVIEMQLFSQIHETGIHKGICDILKIKPDNPRFKDLGFSIADISPVASQTSYDDDSSDGGIVGTVSLKFSYLARF
ncbi:hypothetical protein [Escherichia coli]|uniref:hypothetical protein n=1 Tax=Escherichia coli TaxID=562 RepID=UPI000B3ECE9A|nr:hypothetical protein [Escherichia coli]EFI2836375.1 hypothetical protein [Escherichia coli]